MSNAFRDENRVTTLLAISNADGVSLANVYVNPTSHGMITALPVGTMPVKNAATIGENRVANIMAVSNVDGTTPVAIGVKASTNFGIFEQGI